MTTRASSRKALSPGPDDAPHLPLALLQGVHAVHARMHQMVDIPVGDGGLSAGAAERARGVKSSIGVSILSPMAGNRVSSLTCFPGAGRDPFLPWIPTFAGMTEQFLTLGRDQDQGAAAIGHQTALQQAERVGDHPRIEHIVDRDRRLESGARVLRRPFMTTITVRKAYLCTPPVLRALLRTPSTQRAPLQVRKPTIRACRFGCGRYRCRYETMREAAHARCAMSPTISPRC